MAAELANRDAAHAGATAGVLADDLGLDAGYLSRILRKFEAQRLLGRKPTAEDRRSRIPPSWAGCRRRPR